MIRELFVELVLVLIGELTWKIYRIRAGISARARRVWRWIRRQPAPEPAPAIVMPVDELIALGLSAVVLATMIRNAGRAASVIDAVGDGYGRMLSTLLAGDDDK